MGKHFWWGCLLLAILLAGTAWIGFGMEKANAPIRALLEQAQQAAHRQQLDRAMALVAQADALWDSEEGFVSAVADHTPMDQIRELFAEAMLFGQGGDSVHFSTVCARLSSLLADLIDAHKLTLRNLF